MAVLHRAYHFDANVFHRTLRSTIFTADAIDDGKLQDAARAAVATASPVTQDMLIMLRFDPELLVTPEPDVSRTHLWYLFLLAQSVQAAPSLGNRFCGSYYLLERVLPLVGWAPTEVTTLIRGLPLHTLVESSGDSALFAELRIGLDPYGGWLPSTQARPLLARLQQQYSAIHTPSEQLQNALSEYAEWNRTTPTDLLERGYADALEMLQTTIAKQKDLFIILD
jgi:hypothetical protein